MGLKLKKPEDIQGKSWPAIAIGLFVAFGGVLFGYVKIWKFFHVFLPLH
jgi:SP family sugar:H+ symporter-like MFS transporter